MRRSSRGASSDSSPPHRNFSEALGRKTERLFWQSGGGYDRNGITRKSLLPMIDDLHDNPMRKQLVLRSRDWKWSSAAWYDDRTPVPLIPDQIPFDWLEEW